MIHFAGFEFVCTLQFYM